MFSSIEWTLSLLRRRYRVGVRELTEGRGVEQAKGKRNAARQVQVVEHCTTGRIPNNFLPESDKWSVCV
jgi:hypothetical protein